MGWGGVRLGGVGLGGVGVRVKKEHTTNKMSTIYNFDDFIAKINPRGRFQFCF